MNDSWFDDFDGIGLATAIRSGEVTAVDAVDVAIRRIEERNPTLNAVVATRFDAARAEAATAATDGPFAGVPFVVKSLGAEIEGMPTTRGSRLFAEHVARADSVAMARARAAGVIVVGMTNTPELGKNGSTEPVLHGPTRNPYRATHSAGGSSGGSAAAVASGMVPIAHGNDGGGSIRIPAAACGLFGLKPSRGRVPNLPALDAFSYPFACNHALTRTVRDSAALLDAIAGPVPGDPYAVPASTRAYLDDVSIAPGRLRIGWTTTTARGVDADADCVAAVERALAVCVDLGHEVTEARFAYDVDAFTHALSVVMATNVATAVDGRLAHLDRGLADDDLEPFTRIMYDRARATPASELITAMREVEAAGRSVAPFFAEHDVLVTPTMQVMVPELGWADTTKPETMARAAALSAFTGIFNATGQPAMSVPSGLDRHGLPIGVQFATRYGGESLLFQLAGSLEAAAPWPTRPVWPPA